MPAVNQIELSPYLPQTEFLEYCSQKGIHLTAWSPLGGQGESGKGPASLLQHSKVKSIADRLECSTGQVLISWGVQVCRTFLSLNPSVGARLLTSALNVFSRFALQRGTSVIPKSSTHARITTNGTLVKLTADDVAALDTIHKDDANPSRIASGASATKKALGWTYEEMGWENRETL